MTATGLPPFRAPRWLSGGHAQTIYAALAAPRPRVAYRRTRWDTPDGDFIDLDWVQPQQNSGPLLVLFHGLEGSSRSHYALALMAEVARRGGRGVVVHFRGCSGEPNRLARAYHSGDSTEIDWILRRLHGSAGVPILHAVGVSLGGNALLKWLGEQGAAAQTLVHSAAAVSAPMDLTRAGNHLDRGFNQVYVHHFLRTMKRKSLIKNDILAFMANDGALRRVTTLRAFDNLITAPLHGYRDTDDYWHRASSKPLLRDIAVPTLLINARDDPFLPHDALPGPTEVSSSVTLDFPAHGGHVGFVSGTFPGHLDWLPRRILAHLGFTRPQQD